MESQRDKCCSPYLDDVLCYSTTFEGHMQALQFFKQQVRYIGQVVSSKGVQIDPKDSEEVAQLKEREPKTVGEVRASLGFLSYYRSYIQDLARLARPLFELV